MHGPIHSNYLLASYLLIDVLTLIIAMALIYVVLVYFLLLILTGSTSSQRVVYVNPIKGADHHACLTYTSPGAYTPCKSLKYVSQELGRDCSNLTIQLESSEHKLDCLVSFENCSHLSIVGYDTSGGFTKVFCKSCIYRSNTTHSLTVESGLPSNEQCSKNICNRSDDKVGASLGAGLRFTTIDNLCLSNLQLIECGADVEQKFNTALQIHACSSVVIDNVHFERSLGTAIAFFNTFRNVSIQEVNIFNNKIKRREKVQGLSYAGGLHIQFTSQLFDPFMAATTYTISKCTFYNNAAPYEVFDPRNASSLDDWLGYGLGGGIGLAFMNRSSGISVVIKNCNFTNNSAPFGAGLSVFFQGHTVNNRVSVVDSKFCSNRASVSGGGANVGLGKLHNFHDNQKWKNYGVSFERTVFERNSARYGGGVSVHALHSEFKTKSGELIHFKNCNWLENFGKYSPAVDISPFRFDQLKKGLLPIPKFTDCSFVNNVLIYKTNKGTTFPYSGVFVVSLFIVHFSGTINFEKNKYSAFYMTSGRAIFESGAHVCYHSNIGIKGAAIALYGFSSLVASNGSLFEFINNTAIIVGGGMYHHSNEQRDYIEGRNCFLQYDGPELPVAERNLTFYFADNKAAFGGTSIYSTSFYSCFHRYLSELRYHRLDEFFDYIGNFVFSDNQQNESALSTAGMNFSRTASLLSIPGKKFIVPLSIVDEFHVAVKSDLSLRIEDNTNFYLGNYYTSDNNVQIFGPPGESANLLLSTQSTIRSVYHSIKISLLLCPPGFYLDLKTNGCRWNQLMVSTKHIQELLGVITQIFKHTFYMVTGLAISLLLVMTLIIFIQLSAHCTSVN